MQGASGYWCKRFGIGIDVVDDAVRCGNECYGKGGDIVGEFVVGGIGCAYCRGWRFVGFIWR